MIVSFAVLDPDLLRERMRPGGKKPPFSLRIFSLVLSMHWVVAGLDRGRFHWSDDLPGWLQGVCLFTVAAGYALALWAMRVNRFFSSVIRIQTDRGQHVVSTGPYALVRHPGYTAGILIIAASGPALGSWLAAALVVIFSLRFCIAPLRRTEFFRSSLRAIRITPRGSDGGFYRAFGESQSSSRKHALRNRRGLPTRLIFPCDPKRRVFVPMSHALAPASRFRNATSPASDTLTHFGSGALAASSLSCQFHHL